MDTKRRDEIVQMLREASADTPPPVQIVVNINLPPELLAVLARLLENQRR